MHTQSNLAAHALMHMTLKTTQKDMTVQKTLKDKARHPFSCSVYEARQTFNSIT